MAWPISQGNTGAFIICQLHRTGTGIPLFRHTVTIPTRAAKKLTQNSIDVIDITMVNFISHRNQLHGTSCYREDGGVSQLSVRRGEPVKWTAGVVEPSQWLSHDPAKQRIVLRDPSFAYPLVLLVRVIAVGL